MTYSLADEWTAFVSLRNQVLQEVEASGVQMGSAVLATTARAENPTDLQSGIYMMIGYLDSHSASMDATNLTVKLKELVSTVATERRAFVARAFKAAREEGESRA